MGWFENQIQERRSADQQLLEDSFVKIAGVVLGKRTAEKLGDARIITKNAIDEILKYYHCKPTEIPEEIRTTEEQLDFSLYPHGLMRRTVELSENWYRDAFGPILAFLKEDGFPVAILPGFLRGYVFTDPTTGQRMKLDAKTAARFDRTAVCFYRPLPGKKLAIPDLLLYMKRCVSMSDVILFIAATLAVTLVGLIMPRITKTLTGPVLASGRGSALIGVAVCMVCVAISARLLESVKSLFQSRLTTKTSLSVQASMMMRLLSLPASFFRRYSPGELKSRAVSVGQLCSLLLSLVMSTSLTSLTSLLYIGQILRFTPALAIPSVAIVLITVIFSVISTLMQTRVHHRYLEHSVREAGVSYSLITGVQKIKLSGAEKRVFAKWLEMYAEGAALKYDPPLYLKLNTVISTAISLVSTIVLYVIAVRSRIDQSSYYAFTAAYGMLMGAFMSVSGIALSAAQIRPILEMAEPFLKSEPEMSGRKEIVRQVCGSIELDHVSFRYDDASPYVLNDLSLKIGAGEYVALVGRTGCGKSTLVRLLLGFEKPEKGTILYDGKNLDSLDLPSLRKKIGTVMQDAGLFQGDIYSNIVITAPELTMDDAWEAAETAGIANDIRAMPMGMRTIVGEGQGGISGGQRQRLMIARAIAPKPKLLVFDEATSALDNKTQRYISEALDSIGCTRVVIAHRLSTIRNCDRILVMDGGKIVEDGTYDELIGRGGSFAELVARQRTGIAG